MSYWSASSEVCRTCMELVKCGCETLSGLDAIITWSAAMHWTMYLWDFLCFLLLHLFTLFPIFGYTNVAPFYRYLGLIEEYAISSVGAVVWSYFACMDKDNGKQHLRSLNFIHKSVVQQNFGFCFLQSRVAYWYLWSRLCLGTFKWETHNVTIELLEIFFRHFDLSPTATWISSKKVALNRMFHLINIYFSSI